jgi:nucleoside-diphosphate-sugar epimerase
MDARVMVLDKTLGDDITHLDSFPSVDSVVHLAALRDAQCSEDPKAAQDVNVEGTKAVVEAAERTRAKRIVFASSCSIYGRQDGLVDEESPLSPTSTYGKTKAEAEEIVRRSSVRTKTILRFGTLFGGSPNMRWDTILNQFVHDATRNGKVEVFEPDAWRPLLHVKDAALAIISALELPYGSLTVNVGFGNYQKRRIGEIVKAEYPKTEIQFIEDTKDKRSYRVSFKRMVGLLPLPKSPPEYAIKEIAASL